MNLPNIIIIIIDTLRKDYASPVSTVLKNFGFIQYEDAIAPAPWTTPSHASIFTGVYPAIHEAHESKYKKAFEIKLDKNKDILSTQLLNWGYKTYLLSANPYINPHFGFTGFDYFYEFFHVPPSIFPLSIEEIKKLRQKYNMKSGLETTKALMINREYKIILKLALNYAINKPHRYIYSKIKKWPLDKGVNSIIKKIKNLECSTKKTPIFIFINLMEVHEPYRYNERHPLMDNLRTNKLEQRIVKCWKFGYIHEVKYITKKITDLIMVLKKRNIFDDSLIIVTSDHGQLLGEHERIGHGTFLYDELLRIPLFIKYPRNYNIKFVKPQGRYISLVNFRSFILDIIKNEIISDDTLYSDTVFAECYGVQHSIPKTLNEKERKNIEYLEKYRIAVYYKNLKAVFNVNDWKFEDIKSYNPNIKITEDAINNIKDRLLKFMKISISMKKIKDRLNKSF